MQTATLRVRTLLTAATIAAGLLPQPLCADGALSAARSPSTADAPGWSLYDRYDRTYFVPYIRPVHFAGRRPGMFAQLQIDGGPIVGEAQLDTGSQGVVIASQYVPGFRPGGISGSIFYSSSQLTFYGYWQKHVVRLPQSRDEAGRTGVVEAEIPVFVATRKCRSSTNCTTNFTVAMIGIGFGRPDDGYTGYLPSLDDNPLLNVPAMKSGRMRAGYVMSATGVQVGLTAENAGSRFAWTKLQPLEGENARNWTPMPGLMRVNGRSQGAGIALLDSGLTYMIGKGAKLQRNCEQPPQGDDPFCPPAPGTRVQLQFLGAPGIAGLSFRTGGPQSPGVPAEPVWWDWERGDTPFFNTGVQAFADFTLAVDAVGGYAGLALAGDAANAYVNPTLVLAFEPTFPRGLSSDLPVILDGPTSLTSPRRVALSGALSGGGPLTVAARPFVYAGEGEAPGGITVARGTFILTGQLRANVSVLPGAKFINRGKLIGKVTHARDE